MAYLLSTRSFFKLVLAARQPNDPVVKWCQDSAEAHLIFASIVSYGMFADYVVNHSRQNLAEFDALNKVLRVVIPQQFDNAQRIISLDKDISLEWANLRNLTDSVGNVISTEDAMVLATARQRAYALIGEEDDYTQKAAVTVIDPAAGAGRV